MTNPRKGRPRRRTACASPRDSRAPAPGLTTAGPRVTRLEGIVQQLRQMLEAHDTAPRWVPLEMTREAVALARSLLHGWQVQQAMT